MKLSPHDIRTTNRTSDDCLVKNNAQLWSRGYSRQQSLPGEAYMDASVYLTLVNARVVCFDQRVSVRLGLEQAGH